MICLVDAHVRRQLGDADDKENNTMRLIQDLNDYATTTLNMHGFNEDLLKAQIEKPMNSGPLTQPNTKDRVLLLAKAKRRGAKFTATGGDHLTSDDFFKSAVAYTYPRQAVMATVPTLIPTVSPTLNLHLDVS